MVSCNGKQRVVQDANSAPDRIVDRTAGLYQFVDHSTHKQDEITQAPFPGAVTSNSLMRDFP